MSNLDKEIALVHREVRKVFGVLTRNDFSPIGTRIGTRREQLTRVWKRAGYRHGAEIGVWRGYFSRYVLKNIPGVHMHCIDPWAEYPDSKFSQDGQERNYAAAMEKLKPYIDAGRCRVHRKFSETMHRRFSDGQLDFIFIDGGHMFDDIAMDLIKWVPKVRLGGMVAVHDYNPMRKGGVVPAVDAYTKCHLIHPWFVITEARPTAFWIREN